MVDMLTKSDQKDVKEQIWNCLMTEAAVRRCSWK